MRLSRRQFLQLVPGAAALAFIAVTLSGQSAWNQSTRTIRTIVPFPPGGSEGDVRRPAGLAHAAQEELQGP